MRPSNKVVSYFYDEEVGNYSYGETNPMRPHRLRLTHNLIHNYGLTSSLIVHRPTPREISQLTEFHADGKGFYSTTRVVIRRIQLYGFGGDARGLGECAFACARRVWGYVASASLRSARGLCCRLG